MLQKKGLTVERKITLAELQCRFKDAECHLCHRRGHIRAVCHQKTSGTARTSSQQSAKQTQHRVAVEEPEEPEDVNLTLYTVTEKGNSAVPPIHAEFEIGGKLVRMEVDTGATFSVVGQATYNELWPNSLLQPSDVTLEAYGGEKMPVCGEVSLPVSYHGKMYPDMKLLVVSGDKSSLMGRDWLQQIRLDWNSIFAVKPASKSLDSVLAKHATVFDGQRGLMKGFQADLKLREDATPVFKKSRTVPYAIRPSVEAELSKLENDGVLKKVKISDWASPIVVITKANNKVRICGDYKVSLNPMLNVDQYPLPNPEDLFATMAGGVVFSKLDLSTAYLQLELTEKSKPLLTINTHKGLYEYQRLNYGVASAPAIFQEVDIEYTGDMLYTV